MQDHYTDGFSIVLCTFNGKSRLAPTLKHLAGLRVPGGKVAELVVVNNASTDGTEAFVQEEWRTLGAPYPLRLVQEHRAGKGYAVETGYDAAQCRYIVTVDDDNWLDKEYLLQAQALLESDTSIGILQGNSTGAFEQEPPFWMGQDGLEHFFVIGGPIKEPGYYPENNFGAWGAGMVLRKADWEYLRTLGFSFLTCKLPGKAAGEDHELAIGLLLMGRKIYYSNKLRFQHFMPAERVTWDKLKQNFETFGYATHFNFLYALTLDAYRKGYELTGKGMRKKFLRYWIKSMKGYTLKQHLSYWLKPQEQYYQLRMRQYYAQYKWFSRLSGKLENDVHLLQRWMLPLLKKYNSDFVMNHLFPL